MIARGVMLGADQPVILHMLDIPPAAEALNGVKMELVDAAFPLLKGIVASTDAAEACKGVNVAVMVGGFPRKEVMERKDVMEKNVSMYKSQASALEQHAAPNYKGGEQEIEVDTTTSVVQPSGKSTLPELEIFCYLIVLLFLIDQKTHNEAKSCASTSIARLKSLKRRVDNV